MIHSREVTRGDFTVVEFWRDDADRVYVIRPEDAEACRRIRNTDARWKCLHAARIAERKKREGE